MLTYFLCDIYFLLSAFTEAPLFAGNWPAIDTAYGNGVTKVLNGEQTAQQFADTICTEVAPEFAQ